MKKFAFQLEERAALLGVWIDEDLPAAAIDDQRVARLHLAQNSTDARNSGNAAAASDNRGVARLAAGLGDNAAHLDAPQGDDLRREQLVGHNDDRPLQHVAIRR